MSFSSQDGPLAGRDLDPYADRAERGREDRRCGRSRSTSTSGRQGSWRTCGSTSVLRSTGGRHGPRPAVWPARAGQDVAGPHHRRRARRRRAPTSGPVIERSGDLAAILNSLGEREVLFIDEIHRGNRTVEEVLYSAVEDFRVDLMLGSGPGAQSVSMPLPRFTLVRGHHPGRPADRPLRERFQIHFNMDFYSPGELAEIIRRSAARLGLSITDDGALELARRSRGTPRVANRLLRRARDFADVEGSGALDAAIVKLTLERLGIDDEGLDEMDRTILSTIAHKFTGGPVGVDNLSTALGEERDVIEDVYEPYLIRQGFLQRTRQGRMLTPRGAQHLGLQATLSASPEDPQGRMF